MLVADRVYRLFTAFMWCTRKRQSRAVISKGSFAPFTDIGTSRIQPVHSIISRPRVLVADGGYKPLNTILWCTSKHLSTTVVSKGAADPLP